jgi:3D (Asp-Asp-Asp) domain-containing protein
MKSLFHGSAVIAAALLASSLIISARPSIAETLLSTFQQQKQEPAQTPKAEAKGAASQTTASDQSSANVSGAVTEITDAAGAIAAKTDSATPASSPTTYIATAYSLSGRTAIGKRPARGFIAADPSLLPIGSRVRLDAGDYTGEYVVADTGGGVRGRKIDIWIANRREAARFGRRAVVLTVLSYGPKLNSLRRRRR